jgi:hypothetical protein
MAAQSSNTVTQMVEGYLIQASVAGSEERSLKYKEDNYRTFQLDCGGNSFQ